MKKKNLISFILAGSMVLLTACKGGENSKSSGNLSIGINQFSEHSALEDVKNGFVSELEGSGIDIIQMNSQGDMGNSISISEKFKKDKLDLVFAIGTPAAQTAKNIIDGDILFSAITDPVAAGLIDGSSNITGTSDAVNIEEQLKLFKSFPVEKIGVIYNTAEENSEIQIKQIKDIAEGLGFQLKIIGINSINDIAQATESLIKEVDGIYTITDNLVASAINIVAQKAIENNLPTVAQDSAHLKSGILLTNGISYFKLGQDSAKMAKDILLNKRDINEIDWTVTKTYEKFINMDTLKKLDLDFDQEILKDRKEI